MKVSKYASLGTPVDTGHWNNLTDFYLYIHIHTLCLSPNAKARQTRGGHENFKYVIFVPSSGIFRVVVSSPQVRNFRGRNNYKKITLHNDEWQINDNVIC